MESRELSRASPGAVLLARDLACKEHHQDDKLNQVMFAHVHGMERSCARACRSLHWPACGAPGMCSLPPAQAA